MKKSAFLVTASFAGLMASGAFAATLSPVATYESTGTASFNLADGLIIRGSSTATFQQPPLGKKYYTYQAEAGHGPVTLTPNVNITTAEFSYQPISIFPPINVPSQSLDLDIPIPVAPGATVVEKRHVSEPLALGNVMAYDFGSFFFGHSLSFGDIVQDQFETGATSVSKSGSLGSLEGMFTYNGVLSDSRDTIEANYELRLSGGELLAGLENFALGLLNDNIGLLADQAIDTLLADAGICSLPVFGSQICNRLGLEGFVTLSANSIGTLSTSYYVSKSITPSPIPLPFGLPLLASGLGFLGLVSYRRKRMAAA